ncbi:tetratricopeptide repeat protein [uncultured Mucilaginibacter sp.]|uniref:tetratricopeptide repeat protein n=1 Tax=uncultured Mucilaginibacter sp. TaxID=797541 RepID=UPI0025F855D6|nr:tetratricopeptide repeat protein [uncultured Mucilaginibacter sp.]
MKNTFTILLILSTLYACKNKDAVNYFNAGVAKSREKTDVGDSAANETARQAKYKAALQDFDQAIEADNNYILAYENRAIVKRALGDYAGCIADAEKVATLEPDSSSVYIFIGQTKLNQLKDIKGAIAAYGQAIKINSNNPNYYSWRAYAEGQVKDYTTALNDYNHAISISPAGSPGLMRFYRERGILKLDNNDKTGCLDLVKAGSLGDADAQEMINLRCK